MSPQDSNKTKRRLGQWKVPQACPGCERADSIGKALLPSSQIIQGEEVHCQTEKWHCNACDAEWMSPAQATAAVVAAVKAFQRKYGMLTGAEVKARREVLRWTQDDLVRESGVSIASIKRLESGVHVQNKSTDQLIAGALQKQADALDYVPLVSYTVRQHQTLIWGRSVWTNFTQEKISSSRMEFNAYVQSA